VPSSGSVAPATSFSSVDLPAPLTPITHQRSLRRTMEVEPVVDHAAAIALVTPFRLDHVLARARRGRNSKATVCGARRLDALDLVELLHPALHLRGVRGARLEALDELDLLGQHRLLALELRLLLLLVQRALLLVELVVARIGGERAAVDLDDLVDDAVHELAVVRGHQQRALVALQELLQPDQAFEVEMVARLVEQHASGRISRMRASATRIFQPPDSAPTSPSIISWLKPRPGQHLARAALERIAVELLEARLHLAVALDDRVHLVGAVGIGHGGLELRQLGRDLADRARAVHHLGHGAAAGHLADVLAEIADGDAAIDRDLALVGLLLAGDHAEQRRLAGAVGADEADLLALLSAAEASMKRIWWPFCLLMLSRRIMATKAGGVSRRKAAGARRSALN
jgi:hypothetical protein